MDGFCDFCGKFIFDYSFFCRGCGAEYGLCCVSGEPGLCEDCDREINRDDYLDDYLGDDLEIEGYE